MQIQTLTVKMQKTASADTGVKFERKVYAIRLYHSQQVFPMAEKQFLNQDHHKVQDSEVKPYHMPRYYPTTVGHRIIARKKYFIIKNTCYYMIIKFSYSVYRKVLNYLLFHFFKKKLWIKPPSKSLHKYFFYSVVTQAFDLMLLFP